MTAFCQNVTAVSVVVLLAAGAAVGAEQSGSDSRLPGRSVDAVTAAAVADRHLVQSGVGDAFSVSDMQIVRDAAGRTPLCYCFDLSPAGYVVVTADMSLPPVIAYSFTSRGPCDLGVGTPLGDLLRWDLGQRRDYADLVRKDVADDIRAAWVAALTNEPPTRGRLFEQWPPAGTTPTGGWLEETWTQTAPYNNLCPMDLVNGGRSLAGCPAIAIAQILDYHARLNSTQFDDRDDYYHNYGGNRYWIDDAYASYSFPSFPQLNAYLDELFDDYFYGTTPSNTHIAALIFACGVGANQVYNSGGSGTFGVDQAFDSYQKFGCDTAALLYDDNSDTYEHLALNMMDACPAHLAVVDPDWTYGHNPVVDGYNTDGYFHLNFGWSGSYNGWYIVPSGLPVGLTVLEGLIINIMTTPCAAGDCTCDGQVDAQDFAYYGDCLSGPASPFRLPGCTSFDNDGDTDVDLRDFMVFQGAFGG